MVSEGSEGSAMAGAMAPKRPGIKPRAGRGPASRRPIPIHPVPRLTPRAAFDFEAAQMSQGFAGGEADQAVVDLAGEQHREAVDRPARLGEMAMEGVEAIAVAVSERVQPGVQAGERLAVR